MSTRLMKGNEAIIHGALLGGATHFFGYPITPASEVAHAAADLFTRSGRTFLQAESEVAAINMVYGASAAGVRVMTASSGPGVALMAEGLSYLAGAELPSLIVDVQRAGPGLGNIWPEQSDYHMLVKGGGHGNYRNIVLAPNSGQELCDMAYGAFELAERYRMTVIIMTDAYIGQMMEPVRFPAEVRHAERNDYAVYADAESRDRVVTSLYLNKTVLSEHNWKLQQKYRDLDAEADWEELHCDDAEILVVAYGITSRIAQTVIRDLRRDGVPIGLFRPRTLFPFPETRLRELSSRCRVITVPELSAGMMAEDVERIVRAAVPVRRHNWLGGEVPDASEVRARIEEELHA